MATVSLPSPSITRWQADRGHLSAVPNSHTKPVKHSSLIFPSNYREWIFCLYGPSRWDRTERAILNPIMENDFAHFHSFDLSVSIHDNQCVWLMNIIKIHIPQLPTTEFWFINWPYVWITYLIWWTCNHFSPWQTSTVINNLISNYLWLTTSLSVNKLQFIYFLLLIHSQVNLFPLHTC